MLITENSIIRDYRIIKRIGEGGMGEVFLASDENLGRNVAIKVLSIELNRNKELIERFKQEARLQASLIHPNIVSLFSFFEHEGTSVMVLEYAEGITLKELIKKTGPIPGPRALKIFKQILAGVEFAHKKGVIHRDIKPSNILVDGNDDVKIMDFGIAKVIGDRGLTKTGTKLGTIYYMSPEQVMGEKDIDGRSDIFSLGITFFEMLTGQLPYSTDTDSDFKLMQQIVENKLPSVKKYYPYVPEKVDEAIEIATKKDRNERFESCTHFLKFIENEDSAIEIKNPKKEIVAKVEKKDIEKLKSATSGQTETHSSKKKETLSMEEQKNSYKEMREFKARSESKQSVVRFIVIIIVMVWIVLALATVLSNR